MFDAVPITATQIDMIVSLGNLKLTKNSMEERQMKKIEVNQETENKSYGEKITKWAGIVGEVATLVSSVVLLINKMNDKE